MSYYSEPLPFSYFGIHQDWAGGQEVRRVITIDEEKTKVIDDALSISTSNEGVHQLHVSIADVSLANGLRLEDLGTIDDKYTLPSRCIGALSLDNGKIRPAITLTMPLSLSNPATLTTVSKDLVIAQAWNHKDFDSELHIPTADARVRDLAYLAIGSKDATTLPNGKVALRIVATAMKMANTAIGQFMWQNNIPAIYSVDDVPKGQCLSVTPSYSKYHGVPAMARFTSPLWRQDDYINHLQFDAFRSNKQVPYSTDDLQEIAECLNEQAKERRIRSKNSPAPPYVPALVEDVRHNLSSEIEKTRIHNITAAVLRKVEGDDQEVVELAYCALDILAKDTDAIRAVIIEAGRNNWLEFKSETFKTTYFHSKSKKRFHMYNKSKLSSKKCHEALTLLADVADLEVKMTSADSHLQ